MFQESDLYIQSDMDIPVDPAYLNARPLSDNNNSNNQPWDGTFDALSAAAAVPATFSDNNNHYSHVPSQQLRHSISWGEEDLSYKAKGSSQPQGHHSHQTSEISVSEASDGSMASDASYFSAFSNSTTPAVPPRQVHGYFSPPLTASSECFSGNQYQWSPMDMMFTAAEFKMNSGPTATLVGSMDSNTINGATNMRPTVDGSNAVVAAAAAAAAAAASGASTNEFINNGYARTNTYNMGKQPLKGDLAAVTPQSEDETLLFSNANISSRAPSSGSLSTSSRVSTDISPSDIQYLETGRLSGSHQDRRGSSGFFTSPEVESPGGFLPEQQQQQQQPQQPKPTVSDEVRRKEILRNSVCSKWVKLSKMTPARTDRIRTLARAKNIDMETVDNVLTLYTDNKHRADNRINRFDGDDIYIKITMGSGSTGINSDSDSDGDHNYSKKKQRKKRPDYVKRPLNSFMLYRKSQTQSAMAYATSSQLKLNHQNISQIIGLMWQTESKELKDVFASFAKQEKEVHRALHPDYKFCPQKKVRR